MCATINTYNLWITFKIDFDTMYLEIKGEFCKYPFICVCNKENPT